MSILSSTSKTISVVQISRLTAILLHIECILSLWCNKRSRKGYDDRSRGKSNAGLQAKDFEQLLEAEKSKETDSLESPEETQLY